MDKFLVTLFFVYFVSGAAMKEKIISIDQGTSSTRSVLYDKEGQFLDSSQEEFDQYFPNEGWVEHNPCLLYTSPSPRDGLLSRMPSSA